MRSCNQCGVAPGEMHVLGCDVERCSLCGFQLCACPCVYEVNDVDEDDIEGDGPTEEMYAKFDAEVERYGGRLPWTGEYPFLDAAAALGFYCYEEPDGQLVECAADHPQAEPNLNKLNTSADWNKVTRRWSRRGN